MKTAEEIMEMLEAFDLVGSLRAAARLVGCDHKTVAHWVQAREQAAGGVPSSTRPRPRREAFAEKVEELVERSQGRIRADVVHDKLVAMGYQGSERTTRRAVAEAKRRYRVEHGRRTRPWIAEPGLWMQWDYGEGPLVDGRAAVLFCAWLAWSRFRVVLPLRDKTMASVVSALDRALRRIAGVPTYCLTDNERTVTTDHVCGIAVRNPQIVAVARHYGMTIATCVPADPQSKGGSEATVRIAKADLVPTEHNLLPVYRDFAALEQACESFCERVNARPHRITCQPPALLLVEERQRLHPLPAVPHTVCFGETRRVSPQATVAVDRATYSVPSALVDERVWVRREGRELVIVHADAPEGPREVARHLLCAPGRMSIKDEHYPPRPPGALARKPRAGSADEAAFLALGPTAEQWLVKAAAAGAARVKRKIAEAVDLAKLHGVADVADALAVCAEAGRFDDGDLALILAHRQRRGGAGNDNVIAFPAPSEKQSLQRSTAAWEGFGR